MAFDRAFSTLSLPPELRVAGWTRAVSDRFVESGFKVLDPEGFDASMLNRDVADLALHPNSPGYRLILNNILFPAAKKKKPKT